MENTVERKSMTLEQIIDTEKEIIAKIEEIKNAYTDKFAELGYEISATYTQKNDCEGMFTDISDDPDNYVNGYSSVAKIYIKNPKTEDDTVVPEDGEEIDEDYANAIEAEKEQERIVAYTELMIIRIYKVFWSEKLSMCNDYEEMTADLDEFYNELASRKEQENA